MKQHSKMYRARLTCLQHPQTNIASSFVLALRRVANFLLTGVREIVWMTGSGRGLAPHFIMHDLLRRDLKAHSSMQTAQRQLQLMKVHLLGRHLQLSVLWSPEVLPTPPPPL